MICLKVTVLYILGLFLGLFGGGSWVVVGFGCLVRADFKMMV